MPPTIKPNPDSWPNDHITIVKNPHFYDAKSVTIETVNFYPSQDYAAALKRFRAGEFDMTVGVPSSEFEWLHDNLPGVLRVTPYIAITCEDLRPPIELMKMIEPSRRAFMSATTSFDSHRLLKTLLVIIRSNT